MDDQGIVDLWPVCLICFEVKRSSAHDCDGFED